MFSKWLTDCHQQMTAHETEREAVRDQWNLAHEIDPIHLPVVFGFALSQPRGQYSAESSPDLEHLRR
jgi:hypothetical protein